MPYVHDGVTSSVKKQLLLQDLDKCNDFLNRTSVAQKITANNTNRK
jgi:hypothetical protein